MKRKIASLGFITAVSASMFGQAVSGSVVSGKDWKQGMDEKKPAVVQLAGTTWNGTGKPKKP